MSEPEDNPQNGPDDQVEPQKAKSNVTFWLIAAVIASCVLLVVVNAIRGPRSSYDPEADAKRVCQEDFVPKRLKAPATANFSGVTVTALSEGYRVTGSVDAQNSFGAMIRSSFSCVVKERGDEWVLVSASVSN